MKTSEANLRNGPGARKLAGPAAGGVELGA